MGYRRKARELVVQTLYGLMYEETGDMLKELEYMQYYPEILETVTHENNLDNATEIIEFADKLLKNLIPLLEDIDTIITEHSKGWPLEKLAKLDLSVLRLAVYEMIYLKTPPPVIIDEAVEISKKFCAENSSKFINAVLDAIYHVNFKSVK